MEGFFSKTEVGSSKSDCKKCKLYKGCKSPKMEETGKGRKKILIIGEAPGKQEDLKGIQFVGEAGQILRNVLDGIGIDLDRDCWKTNAVNCRPYTKKTHAQEEKNRTPTKREISLCRPRVLKVIEEKKPHLIILLGGTALESLISHRYKGKLGGITKWRGFVIPDQDIKTYIALTFHPSYVLRSKGIVSIEKLFRNDLTAFMDYLNKPFPTYHEPKIHVIDRKKAVDVLQTILRKKPSLLSFDYETTGLKPYNKGHEIVCCSISFIRNIAYVFELKSKKVIRLWKTVLKDKEIPKSAHNIKFEKTWSKEILKTTVRAWKWDTMQTAHIMDNRSGITGLKFQVYVNFGKIDYSSHIEKYLEAENGNAFNRIKEAPWDELLKYCGMDSVFQYRLTELQMKEMG